MPYFHLLRIHKPTGFLLLLWPALTALVIASNGYPDLRLIAIFTVGAFIMRSAGCVINDLLDQGLDKKVARTKSRPLPNADLSSKQALACLFILLAVAFMLVMQLNLLSIAIAVAAVPLIVLYPLLKRYTYFPQVFLGFVWSLSILISYAAVINNINLSAIILFFANIVLTIAYDTVYAMSDRDCDIKSGIKSLAVYLDKNDRKFVFLFKLIHAALLVALAMLENMSYWFWSAIIVFLIFAVFEFTAIASRKPSTCLKIFTFNHWPLLIFFIFTLFDYL